MIFKGNFYTDLSGFLDYIVVWLGPWFGIFIVDYILRHGKYRVSSLAATRGGLYWRNGGFNWKALLSLGAWHVCGDDVDRRDVLRSFVPRATVEPHPRR